MIFPIHRDGGSWAVRDYSGRDIICGKDYEEVVDYIQNNWQMLQHTRNKIRNKGHK